MAKRRVPLHGKPQGYVVVDDEATKGATIGVDLRNPDGSLYVPPAAAAPSGGTSVVATLWKLVQNIPANIAALAALTTSGFVRRASDGSFTTESVQAYPEGVSFPSSPATDEKYYRKDLQLLCYFDGTRWLTVDEYVVAALVTNSIQPYAASNTRNLRFPRPSNFGIYLTRLSCSTFVAGTSDSTNYWSVALESVSAANVGTSVVSFDTKTDASNTWVAHDQSIGAVLAAGAINLGVSHTKTGAPGNLLNVCALRYRQIIT